MSRAMRSSLDSLKKYISSSTGRMLKLSKANGNLGERLAPARGGNHDAKIGSRLDLGATFEKDGKKYRRIHWQLNINAENSTIRKEAQKNSHEVWSYADVPMKENPTREEASEDLEQAFTDLNTNMKVT